MNYSELCTKYYESLQEYRCILKKHEALKRAFQAIIPNRLESNLVKIKYAGIEMDGHRGISSGSNISLYFHTTNRSVPFQESNLKEVDGICLAKEGELELVKFENDYYTISSDWPGFVMCAPVNLGVEVIHICNGIGDLDRVVQKFRTYWATRKIQRVVREWFFRPTYSNGHIGLESRRGAEMCAEIVNETQ